MNAPKLQYIVCPLCGGDAHDPWAQENGFTAVRCRPCGLIYVNPRPCPEMIDAAVQSGAHHFAGADLDVVGRRVRGKVARYRRRLSGLFSDRWAGSTPISWLDVGAGYGEVVEAIATLAPRGSRVEGIEPMQPKVKAARRRGLAVTEGYLSGVAGTYDVISAINVFSHLPDFRDFLAEVSRALAPGGEIVIETGNASDLRSRDDFPEILVLPDHLMFAGESQMRRFLQDCGFEIVSVERHRIDTIWPFVKSVAKRVLGRPTKIALPYSSPARTILYRARRERAVSHAL